MGRGDSAAPQIRSTGGSDDGGPDGGAGGGPEGGDDGGEGPNPPTPPVDRI
jgi:hypothetical protein